MEQVKERFEFLCGTGALRAKRTPDAIIRDGQMSLPGIGQCYIRGNHAISAESMTLEVVSSDTRKVVARLVMSAKPSEKREGHVIVGDGSAVETWKLVAYARQGEAGPYLALRLPAVKITAADRRSAGLSTKRNYVAA